MGEQSKVKKTAKINMLFRLCLGDWSRSPHLLPRRVNFPDGLFECSYENSKRIGCDNCIINGGKIDPRIKEVKNDQ
jgi:hypothetical protein